MLISKLILKPIGSQIKTLYRWFDEFILSIIK